MLVRRDRLIKETLTEIHEYDVDAEGNTVARFWEWK